MLAIKKVIPFKSNDIHGVGLEQDHGEPIESYVQEALDLFPGSNIVQEPQIFPLEEIKAEYEKRYRRWRRVRYNENLRLSNWAVKMMADYEGGLFASNGLEVLRHNDPGKQKGFLELYEPIENLKYINFAGEIKAIRNNRKLFSRLLGYQYGLITEKGVYAWFYDQVIRQNSMIPVGKTGEKKLIENYKGRFNKSRSAGYHVRQRLKGELIYSENPIMLTPTISKEKIENLITEESNLEAVQFAILKFGEWIRKFNHDLWNYQNRRGIDWSFVGWVVEFQGEKEDTEERQFYNRGFPHPHIIYDSKWMGNIKEIQQLWPYGMVEITTKKDIMKKYPDRKYNRLSVANYVAKYVSKARKQAVCEKGVHKGLAWLAFTGGRLFSIKHKKEGGQNGSLQSSEY